MVFGFSLIALPNHQVGGLWNVPPVSVIAVGNCEAARTPERMDCR